MRALEYATAALNDLRDILRYIDEHNPDAADRLYGKIKAAVEKLRSMPGIGHRRNDVEDPSYWFHRVGGYIVVYRYDDANLYVVRVVHGRRDFKKLFRP